MPPVCSGTPSFWLAWPVRKALGWPRRCKLAHAFLWEYSYKRLKLAQLLGQLGVSLTCCGGAEYTRRSSDSVGRSATRDLATSIEPLTSSSPSESSESYQSRPRDGRVSAPGLKAKPWSGSPKRRR